ncbi:hypothetical protein [Halorarum salinum]|uniref:Histidine kinase n=1 Tax=Halorarum salinum TaxID=2743089 RepID=A0A7D5LC31_9EURY|nr:hypothetical protein [Halobaculum salinum]QLG62409.1 hypothetical protein HUG12_11985 [Halobaculum salinum]
MGLIVVYPNDMATEVDRTDGREAGLHPWIGALVAGLLAGLSMGVVLSVGTELMPLIGALYGMESVLGGWIAHLANSVVFALLFAAVLSRDIVRHESFTLSTYLGIGIGYGAVLGVVTAGVLFPLWLDAGTGVGLPFPFLPFPGTGDWFVSSLVLGLAHLVYGAVLGPAYAVASRSVPAVHR